jgi:alpha-D-ribose 1-methylphosphonate 5-triphosphate synthase subunit PhnH
MIPATTLAPLDHHGSQRVFRVLLDALCRPGSVIPLATEAARAGDPPAALLVPMALAGVEVALAVLEPPESPAWADSVAGVTGASVVALERADIVVGLRAPTPEEVRSLRRGSDESPELGARLVLSCAGLDDGSVSADADRRVVLDITGPGVAGRRRLGVEGLPVELFEALILVNREFPLGVDTFLVASRHPDRSALVAGLPRSSRIRIDQGGMAWATPQ